MKILKKNNISQGSSINSPVPVNKDCDLPPFFNPDYFAHVVVQTLDELNSIPCKLRQDGMVATVVQDSYSEWQLQSSRTGFGICDNNAWVKISIGDEVFNGGNLFLFQTEEQANEFMGSTQFKEGQIIYISDLDRYFKFDGQDGLTDAFPNKLDKPTVQGLDNPNYKIPAYLDGKPYWRSSSDFEKVKSVNSKTGDVILKTSDLENDSDYTTNNKLNKEIQDRISADNLKLDKPTTNNTNQFVILGDGSTAPKNDFGKVDTVNGIEPDNNKNVNLGIDDILPKGMPLEETLDDNKKVLLYDDTGKSYWKSLSEVGKVKTVDNIGPDEQGNITTKYQELKESLDNEIVERARVDNLKLDKPTTTGSTISHPNVVGVDDLGNSAKLPAGDLGKNFANTNLVVKEPRKHTGNSAVEFAMPMVFSNLSQEFSGLQDKSIDATFNKIIGADGTGNLGYIGGTAIVNKILELPNNSPEILSLFYKLNGNFTSASRISTLAIFPPVLEEGNGVIHMSLLGNGLIIPEDERITTVEAIHLETYNSYKIGFINYNNNTLKVLFDTSLYPVGTYKIRIVSGVQAHITNETFELKNKNSIQQIDVNTLTWNNFKNVGSTQPLNSIQQISPNSIKISREYGRDTSIGGVSVVKEIMLSDLVFNENENFSIEMEVIYKGQNYASGGISEFDVKDFIGLILDSVIDSDNQLAIPINIITTGSSAANQFIKTISSYWWNANLCIRNMNTTINSVLNNSQGENYTCRTYIVISRKNGVLYSTINGFNTIITTGNTDKFRLFFGVANSNGTQTYESVRITNIIKF